MTTMMIWRSNIDALAFKPDGWQGYCVVHRRAFRTLLGFDPTPRECKAYFRAHHMAFEAAASAKIAEKKIASGLNFHLTSRNVARQLRSPSDQLFVLAHARDLDESRLPRICQAIAQ